MSKTGLPRGLNGQRGMTLLVGLIMVLLMTLVGMAAIRGSGMQELMAGNMRDHNLALQAAEAALRAGEERLEANNLPAFNWTADPDDPGASNPNPELMEALDEGGNSEFWKSYSWTTAKTTTLGLERVARQPEYVIEEITTLSSGSGATGGGIDFDSVRKQNDMVIYRVSARGFGGAEETQIVLQSTYMR